MTRAAPLQVAGGRRMDVPEATLRYLAAAASAHLEGLVQQAVRKHAVRANPSRLIPGMVIKSQVRGGPGRCCAWLPCVEVQRCSSGHAVRMQEQWACTGSCLGKAAACQSSAPPATCSKHHALDCC